MSKRKTKQVYETKTSISGLARFLLLKIVKL